MGQSLDDRELDAMFVEAVNQCGFGKSRSWSVHTSPGKYMNKNEVKLKLNSK